MSEENSDLTRRSTHANVWAIVHGEYSAGFCCRYEFCVNRINEIENEYAFLARCIKTEHDLKRSLLLNLQMK